MLPRDLVNTLFVLISCASVEGFRIQHKRKRSRPVVNMDQDARTLSAPKAEPKARTTISLAEEKEAKVQPARARAAARMRRKRRNSGKMHDHSADTTNDQAELLHASPWIQTFTNQAPFEVHMGVTDVAIGIPAPREDGKFTGANNIQHGESVRFSIAPAMSVSCSAGIQYQVGKEGVILALQYVGKAVTKEAFLKGAEAAIAHAIPSASQASHLGFVHGVVSGHAIAHGTVMGTFAHTLTALGVAAAAGFTMSPPAAVVALIAMAGIAYAGKEAVETYVTQLAFSTVFFYMTGLLRLYIETKKVSRGSNEEIEETWVLNGATMTLMKASALNAVFSDPDSHLQHVSDSFFAATRFIEGEVYLTEDAVKNFLHEMHTWGIYQQSILGQLKNISQGRGTHTWLCAGFAKPLYVEGATRMTQGQAITATGPRGTSRSPTPDKVRGMARLPWDTAAAPPSAGARARPSRQRSRSPGDGFQEVSAPKNGNSPLLASSRLQRGRPGSELKVPKKANIWVVWAYQPLSFKFKVDECSQLVAHVEELGSI